MYPDVDVTIEQNFLGEGITGIKGVLKSMRIESAMEGFAIDGQIGITTVPTGVMTVQLEVILTSVKLGPEKVEEITKEIVNTLERAIDF